jgi:hypothetical protein
MALAGCGGGTASTESPAGTVGGAIHGATWNRLASAFWIGKPSAAPPVTFLFLFETPTTCAELTSPNWDKIIGNEQVLEIELREAARRTFQVKQDASVAYLRGEYNPDGDGGTVTVTGVTPAARIAGSFDLTFAGQSLRGSFDAAYCADGVEP